MYYWLICNRKVRVNLLKNVNKVTPSVDPQVTTRRDEGGKACAVHIVPKGCHRSQESHGDA